MPKIQRGSAPSNALPRWRTRAPVGRAVRAYQEIRTDLAEAVPEWPLGLPGWDDGWLALALRTPSVTYLGLWRRPGAAPTVTLPIDATHIDVLYPQHLPAWDVSPAGAFTSTSNEPYAARIFRIHHLRGSK